MVGDESDKRLPKVFVSYSHDSPQHKQWVEKLAARLREEGGADVVLDKWNTEHGDDLVKFMEKGVRDADRVLMVCTTTYVKKANNGRGGVGYETMVVTGELVRDLGTAKFIPVIPPENEKAVVPTCVGTRKYVDFRDPSGFDQAFDGLVATLHHLGVHSRPAVGLADRFRVADHTVQPSQTDGGADASLRRLYAGLADAMTPCHFAILKALVDPSFARRAGRRGSSLTEILSDLCPELQGRRDALAYVWRDLHTKNLVNTDSLHVAVDIQGKMVQGLTDFGRGFVAFITERPQQE